MRCGAVRCCAVGRGGKGCGVMVGVRVARWHSVTWSGTHADHSQPSPVSPLQYSTVYCKLNCVSRWLAGWLACARPAPAPAAAAAAAAAAAPCPAPCSVLPFLPSILACIPTNSIQPAPARFSRHTAYCAALYSKVRYGLVTGTESRKKKYEFPYESSRLGLFRPASLVCCNTVSAVMSHGFGARESESEIQLTSRPSCRAS